MPFIAWTIIWQLYGDVDSSSESDDSLDNHTSMGDTKISVASSCVNTSFVDDQFIDDLVLLLFLQRLELLHQKLPMFLCNRIICVFQIQFTGVDFYQTYLFVCRIPHFGSR